MGASTDLALDLDEQISQLIQCKPLSKQQVRASCDKAKEILMEESNVQDWTGLNFQEIMDEVEKIRITVCGIFYVVFFLNEPLSGRTLYSPISMSMLTGAYFGFLFRCFGFSSG
ncbi:hypothetical protein GOBAR_AA00283 [Gossypium barbadense]|uniref:Uncharacterized protein n=1 Tax=Gossypium barbadense TaxID=3634 RepID=A0A2P5YXM6_GOSBA|nr:hypothetical protein GOBAR_AA00283 [Gossypium barbadense]